MAAGDGVNRAGARTRGYEARPQPPSLRALAKQSRGCKERAGLRRRSAPRNDVDESRHNYAFSRHDAPELCKFIGPQIRGRRRPSREGAVLPPEGSRRSQEGRREDRVRAAPAVSRANADSKAHTSIQVQRKQSGLPCAMVLTVSFELSSVTGLFVTVIRKKRASCELDASTGASGPHGLKSSRFFGLLKTAEAPESTGFVRFLLKEPKARRNPPGPNRP